MTTPISGGENNDPVTQRQLSDFKDYLAVIREADQRALDIKESADMKALELARDHQQYRDEQANQLREQINTERGHYASRSDLDAAVAKLEAELKPVLAYMAGQQGRTAGVTALQATLYALAGLAIAALSVALVIAR